MANAMEGIMALQNPPASPAVDPALFENNPITEKAKADPMGYRQEVLAGIEKADPQLVAQFKQKLSGLTVSEEVLQALSQLIDEVLRVPEDYQALRDEFLKDDTDGIFAELLPPVFDPVYFFAFDMALDQLAMEMANAPQRFAEGGVVSLHPIAKAMAAMGRGGDTMLAHITPAEARMLRARGGSGTINPMTGLPEFGFFSGIVKAVKSVVKKATNVVKSVVSGVKDAVKSVASSTIGRLALTVAAGWALGPAAGIFSSTGGLAGSIFGATSAMGSGAMALGINAAAASTIVNLASGMNFGDALKGGAIAGVTAGVGGKVFGLPEGYAAPEGVAALPSVENYMTDAATGQPVAGSLASPIDQVGVTPATGAVTTPMGSTSYLPDVPVPTVPAPSPTLPEIPLGADTATASQIGQGYSITADPSRLGGGIGGLTPPNAVVPSPTSLTGLSGVSSGTGFVPGQDYLGNAMAQTAYGAPSTLPLGSGVTAVSQAPGATAIPNFFEDPWGATKGFYSNYLSPSRPGLPADAGIIQKYGPLAATGLGVAYLGGAFDPVPEEPLPDWATGPTGSELLEQQPEKYGVDIGGGQTVYYGDPNYPGRRLYDYRQQVGYMPGYMPSQPFWKMADGGIASIEPSHPNFPRKNGHIEGPGGPKEDKIPAMLSDGEFVFTAKAVRNMGNGSRRKGAKRMYALMRQLESQEQQKA